MPSVYTIGIAWPTDLSMETLHRILHGISSEIYLSEFYDQLPDSVKNKKYMLRGLILYNLMHYSCYFYSQSTLQWMVMDDTIVKPIGEEFRSVVERCESGHLKPTLLFYVPINK